MDSYQSILDKISVLQKKASALRETEKKRAIAEMRKLIGLYDVQPAELFSDAPPPVVGKPVPAPKKRIRPPKYRDPATGKTWNGLGKRPGWLVGDKDAYLMDAPVVAKSKTVKPKKKTQLKAKPPASRKSATVKAVAKPKPKNTVPPKRAAKRTPTRKTAVPKADSVAPAAASEPAVVPAVA